MGHPAKWDESSFEYHHTPRQFEFPAADQALLAQLTEFAARAWHCLGLRGYARVDFRVDPAGRPWILEVNANPCLSPDAGFVAALRQTNLSFVSAIERIIHDAIAS